MDIIEAMKPNCFELLNDSDTPKENESNKRLQKSRTATEAYVHKCLQLHQEKNVRKTFYYQ